MKKKNIFLALLAVVLIALPFILQGYNEYLLHIMISVGIYIILTLSLNIIIGYSGQFAIGHAAFYGIGAYTAALLIVNHQFSFWAALPLAAIFTGFCGALLGLAVMRLRGDYLGIVTLAFGEIIRLIFVNWVSVTRGPLGIPGISQPSLFGHTFSSYIQFYFLIAVLDLIVVFFVTRLVYSGKGMNFLVVRDDEILARSIGIVPAYTKLLSFAAGAFFAGIAGAFWASYITYINPDTFQYMDSINILTMVVVGGSASIPGSIIGAVIMTLTPELLRFADSWRMVIVGLMIVVMMILKPQGFWGEKHKVYNFFKGKKGREEDGKCA